MFFSARQKMFNFFAKTPEVNGKENKGLLFQFQEHKLI